MNDSTEHIGTRIKAARQEQGLTRTQLAAELDITETTVTRWEQGRNKPGISQLLGLSRVLQVSPEYLLGADEPNGDPVEAAA